MIGAEVHRGTSNLLAFVSFYTPIPRREALPGVRVALTSCRPWRRVGTASRRSCSQSRHSCSQSEGRRRAGPATAECLRMRARICFIYTPILFLEAEQCYSGMQQRCRCSRNTHRVSSFLDRYRPLPGPRGLATPRCLRRSLPACASSTAALPPVHCLPAPPPCAASSTCTASLTCTLPAA